MQSLRLPTWLATFTFTSYVAAVANPQWGNHHHYNPNPNPYWPQPAQITTTQAPVPENTYVPPYVPPSPVRKTKSSKVGSGGQQTYVPPPVESYIPPGESYVPPGETYVPPIPSDTNPTSVQTGGSPVQTGGGNPGACGGGGGGLQIQWTGDPVSLSGAPDGSTTTSGCTDTTGYTGQIHIGGEGGTIFEVNPSNYYDISIILGFSVPVVCTGDQTGAMTGCNIALSSGGSILKNPTGPGGSMDPGTYNGCPTCVPWCYVCDHAPEEFAQCAGGAYAYPYDDGATAGPDTSVTCCVGTGCPSNPKQGSTAGGTAPQMSRADGKNCDKCAGGTAKRSAGEELQGVIGAGNETSVAVEVEEVKEEGVKEEVKVKSKRSGGHGGHVHGKRHGKRFVRNPYSPILEDVKVG